MTEEEDKTRAATKVIRDTIWSEEKRLVSEYAFLQPQYQSAVGLSIFLSCLLAMGSLAWLYMRSVLSWWLVIPLMGLPISILHELEHDLIHNLYCKKQRWLQNIMFCCIWFSKLSLNPWYRRIIHIKHHNVSGSKQDIEERLIGIGLPIFPLRMLISIHPFFSRLLFRGIKRDAPDFKEEFLVYSSLPSFGLFFVIFHGFLEHVRVNIMGWNFGQWDPVTYVPAYVFPIIVDLAVLVVLPNVLRQTCLNLVASYSHYYGDIPKNNVFYQNQILDHWVLLPLQMFCFNFGATHIIHHFVTNQPFYLRQMLAPKVLDVMEKEGIRRNDFGIVLRNNRYHG